MENLRIDENSRWVLGAVANDGSGDIKNARINPITGALIVEATVTSTNTQIGSTIPGGTAGSVLFLGLGGTLSQDNPNFFYDDTNNFLGLGTNTPSATLDVQGDAIITGSAGTPTFVLGRDNSGNISNIVLGANLTLSGGILSANTSGATGYDQIQDNGTNITQRTTLNFVDYFTVTDGSGKTNVSINTLELGGDATLISTLENNMDLSNISGQINLSTQVTGILSPTHIDITNLESTLDLSNISGQIDLTTQVTGLLSPTNIDVVALANDATFISNLEPNLDLANLGGQIDLATQVTGVLPLSHGGTGQALSDPNHDAVYVWDDTTNTTRLAQLSGISYNSGTNTLSASGGSNTAINFFIADTSFGAFGPHQVRMAVNSNDPSRNKLGIMENIGLNYIIKIATIGISGNYNTKQIFTLTVGSNQLLNFGLDDNYIWIINVNFNLGIYSIDSYTYTGTLVSSTPISTFAVNTIPTTITIVGTKLFVMESNVLFSTGTLREYDITGSTVTFNTSYVLSIGGFLGFNLYKSTLLNNNILLCSGSGNSYNIYNYVTNTFQSVQSSELGITSDAVTMGNYKLFAFERPTNGDWMTFSDNDTNKPIKTFASDNLGMGAAFDPQGISL
mgnify:CR=1 FL=1